LTNQLKLIEGISMTWSPADALDQRKNAVRLLLDESGGSFTRSLAWYRQSDSDIPNGIWSLLLEERLVQGHVVGGAKWRLTADGWIEACRLLRDEIDLDKRFGALSKHLKDLTDGRNELNATVTVQEVATNTGLSEYWIRDAIRGQMAERIYGQHGAKIDSMSGYIDIPSHIGNKLSSRSFHLAV
jgi:hypothetical protein